MKRLLVKRVCSGEKAKGVTGQPFAHASERSKGQRIQAQGGLFEETRHVTHGSCQLFQQKTGVEKGLSRKDLQRDLLSNGVNPQDIYGKPTRFLRTL